MPTVLIFCLVSILGVYTIRIGGSVVCLVALEPPAALTAGVVAIGLTMAVVD